MIIYHVGTMKSGTTYLQSILQKNKAALLKHGWRYPGKRLNQQHAVYDLVPNSVPWTIPASGNKNGKLAEDLASQIKKNHSDNIVLSAEVLSCLDQKGIEAVVKTFGQPDKIIFTVRNLAKVIPSAWQQYIKGGGKLSLDKFVEKMEKDRAELVGMWKIYAYGHQIKNWSNIAPVSTVIVPNGGEKTDLGNRFFQSFDIDSDDLIMDVKSTESNLSLGFEIAEILRFLNARHKISESERNYFLKKIVFPKLGKFESSRIQLSSSQLSIVEKWAAEENNKLLDLSKFIYGDDSDLVVNKSNIDGIASADRLISISSEIINSLLSGRSI